MGLKFVGTLPDSLGSQVPSRVSGGGLCSAWLRNGNHLESAVHLASKQDRDGQPDNSDWQCHEQAQYYEGAVGRKHPGLV